MNEFNFAQQGWQCPICKRIYSPFTPMCYNCGGEASISTTTGHTLDKSLDWMKHDSTTSSDTEIRIDSHAKYWDNIGRADWEETEK